MKSKTIAALTVSVAIAAGAAALFAQQAPEPSANLFPYDDPLAVARGEIAYAENCAACHGVNLEGQDSWRSPNAEGRMPAPPHDPSGHTWHHPDAQLFQIVKVGIPDLVGNNYESDMGGYGDILSDAEIIEIMAYIKSTWPDDIIERHNAMNDAAAVN